MPLFYFHMREGGNLIKDEEGRLFEDVETAAGEARASAKDWAIQLIRSGQTIDGQAIEMTDENGVVRLALPIRLVIQ
jgi:hypothetical protein